MTEELAQLESGVAAVRKRRASLDREASERDEAQRLALTGELDQQRKAADLELRDVTETIAIAKTTLDGLTNEIAVKSAENELATTNIKAVQDRQAQLNSAVEELQAAYTVELSLRDGLASALPILREELSNTEARKLEVEGEIERLTKARHALDKSIIHLEADFRDKKAKGEAQLATLSADAIVLADERRQFDHETELVRRDLASRKLAADKLDENVNLRLRKADLAEDRVRANSSLLDL